MSDATRSPLGGATLVTAAGSAVAQAVQLAALVFAARQLGPEAFGVLGFVTATAATAAGVTAFAPALHVARSYSLGHHAGLPRAMGEAIGIGLLALAGLAVARLVGAAPLLRSGATVLALGALLLATVSQLVMAHALIGASRFGALGAMRVAGALAGSVGLAWGAVQGRELAAALGLALGQGVSVLVAVRALRALPPSPEAAGASAPEPQRRAAIAAAVLGGPMLWLAQALVSHRPDGAGEMARIAAVTPLVAAVLFVPGQLGQAWFAIIARATDVRATLRRALQVTALAGGLVGVALAATSPWWAGAYGPGFEALPSVAVPLLAAAAIQGTVAPAVRVLEARGHVADTVWLNTVLAAVAVGGTLASARFGAAGYAHAVAAAFALHGLLLAACVWWRTRPPAPAAVP